MLKGLEILVTGIVVVLAVLILLWISCAVMGAIFRAVEARQTAARAKAEAASAPASAAPAPPPAPTGIPPHHLAVIAAATATVLDGPHRIVRVSAPPLGSTDWANQARLQSFNKSLGQGNWGRAIPALDRANT